jgi:hypothetical protein
MRREPSEKETDAFCSYQKGLVSMYALGEREVAEEVFEEKAPGTKLKGDSHG